MLDQLIQLSIKHKCKRFYCALTANDIVVISLNSSIDPILASANLKTIEFLVSEGHILINLKLLRATRFPPDLSINYQQIVALDMVSQSSVNTLTILFLSANPINKAQLELEREVAEIRRRLISAGTYYKFRVIHERETRAAFIASCIMRYNPDIIHFSGHGNIKGEVSFLDDFNQGILASPKLLSEIFSLASSKTKIVVFNACYSEIQAKEVTKFIDFAIGMNDQIEDEYAILFSSGFYEALAHNKSIDEAFKITKHSLRLLGVSDSSVPKLLLKNGADPKRIIFNT